MAMVRSVMTGCRALAASASLASNASQRTPIRGASRGVRHSSSGAFRVSERVAQFKQSFSSTLNEKRSKASAGASGKVVRGASAVVLCQAALKESATGVEFPETIGPLTCLGAGVREKKIAILKVKVYALACYVEAEGAKAALAAGETLLSGAFDKAICLQLVRDVDGKTFFEALNESVKPRLALIATNQATKENEDGDFMSEVAEAAEKAEEAALDALEEIGDYFLSKSKLSSGTKVMLRVADGKTLQVSAAFADGGAELELESAELCEAIMDVYLGIDPISPAALDAFNAGAAKACA
uniref:Chalcone isomerase domain-containing protein n=1 Tax=Pyramimonas obovata TaxID=1411642 RepID=A0A7S0R466_9CHLO|eukprot:CAMPEP_0118932716 /NCGR_PEP_ID=MMETSP1169-20130426/10583_1 /TAXON_ID=36882 /ORGANISM="Pyramimonas obovata, Strain CCMP722" /LENGTH=298 /DNA_ID=CAMNT_0006875413 /DNA_START=31 /DNA_END=927 /DNA_ORIENTATION=-